MGDIKWGGSQKQKTTQTRNVAPPTAQEALLQAQNQQAAMAQAQMLQQAMQQQQQFEQSPGYTQLAGLSQQAGQGLQQQMSGNAPLINPAQQQALQQYFQSIMAPQQQQMQQTAGQEAARRGMTISDSPIGVAYLQNLANYNAQMGGQQAGQALQLQGNNRQMYQNMLGLTGQLQNQAAQNRLQLAQAQPGSYNFGQQLAQNRIQSAPITQQTTGSRAPAYQFGVGDALGAAQTGLNLYQGNARTGQPGLRSLWEK